jgi:hypothetical protein
MTLTFENDHDVIVYALEKVISYARRTQQIFVAQCVWWLVSIIGLESNLISHIDNLNSRNGKETISPVPRDIQEDIRRDQVLEECEEYLKESRRLRDIASLKSKGTTQTGRINPTRISKKALKGKDYPAGNQAILAGIDKAEIQRRRKAGECLGCAWPAARKGRHQLADCRRPIKLENGTASSLPKAKGK